MLYPVFKVSFLKFQIFKTFLLNNLLQKQNCSILVHSVLLNSETVINISFYFVKMISMWRGRGWIVEPK